MVQDLWGDEVAEAPARERNRVTVQDLWGTPHYVAVNAKGRAKLAKWEGMGNADDGRASASGPEAGERASAGLQDSVPHAAALAVDGTPGRVDASRAVHGLGERATAAARTEADEQARLALQARYWKGATARDLAKWLICDMVLWGASLHDIVCSSAGAAGPDRGHESGAYDVHVRGRKVVVGEFRSRPCNVSFDLAALVREIRGERAEAVAAAKLW